MTWSTLLYVSVVGFAFTLGIVIFVIQLGLRYRRELPKLPIFESIEALKLQREEKEAEFEERREQLYQANLTIEEAAQKSEALVNLKAELDSLNEQILSLGPKREELDSVLRSIQSETDKLDQFRAEIVNSEGLLAQANHQRTQLEEELRKLEADRERQQGEIDEKVSELKSLDNRQRTLGQEVLSLEAKERLLSDSLHSKEARIQGHEAAISTLNEKESELRNVQAELSGDIAAKQRELEQLGRSVEQVKATLATLIEQMNESVSTLKEIRLLAASAAGASPDDHDPCEDLWVPQFTTDRTTRPVSDEGRELEVLKSEIQDAGIEISVRALLAFHTSLKTQDISPITVLAGISGTGKSLLPRIYSRCMGIRFLNLPVQPGWSSPQDLFGFYNYIEQKYKATPLARAMIQFDKYKDADWPLPDDAPDLNEQILLVLLDEMNLARIEYYFSELLSRLETRRDIDPDDPASRHGVQVPLDIGHGTKMYSAINVYPGRNILFAGTMNEDESTLSLSDKVLDRSSVLRFGKPQKFQLDQPNIERLPNPVPLAYSTWLKWCDAGPRHIDSTDFIADVGAIMEDVQKPFGHRSGQAIARYIEQYPDKSEEGVRNAKADQIEQRILPKLRGIDLEQNIVAINRLRSLVSDQLEDDFLASAIEKGTRSDQGMFSWSGLDRYEE